MGDNQHQKIKGYRDLSEYEIDLINKINELSELCGEVITTLQSNVEGNRLDQRWVSIGKTDLQTGFMALVRAVAQPTTF